MHLGFFGLRMVLLYGVVGSIFWFFLSLVSGCCIRFCLFWGIPFSTLSGCSRIVLKIVLFGVCRFGGLFGVLSVVLLLGFCRFSGLFLASGGES